MVEIPDRREIKSLVLNQWRFAVGGVHAKRRRNTSRQFVSDILSFHVDNA